MGTSFEKWRDGTALPYMRHEADSILYCENWTRKFGVGTMDEFLTFFDTATRQYPMRLEIYYSRIMDWCIDISKLEDTKPFIRCQSCDVELVFAQAQVKLKEWLIENRGGY